MEDASDAKHDRADQDGERRRAGQFGQAENDQREGHIFDEIRLRPHKRVQRLVSAVPKSHARLETAPGHGNAQGQQAKDLTERFKNMVRKAAKNPEEMVKFLINHDATAPRQLSRRTVEEANV